MGSKCPPTHDYVAQLSDALKIAYGDAQDLATLQCQKQTGAQSVCYPTDAYLSRLSKAAAESDTHSAAMVHCAQHDSEQTCNADAVSGGGANCKWISPEQARGDTKQPERTDNSELLYCANLMKRHAGQS